MAITKTTTVELIEVRPAANSSAANSSNEKYNSAMVVYKNILDDSSDDDLPVTAKITKYFYKFVADGGAATNYSSEDALVKAVLDAIWE